MDNMQFSEIVKKVGDWVSFGISWLIENFSKLGSGKIISLVILGLAFYFSLKIAIKVLKIILLIVIICLILSVGFSGISSLLQ